MGENRISMASGNTTYVWACFSRAAAVFLRDVLPHLKVKRARAELAVAFQDSMFIPGCAGHTPEHVARQAAFRAQMRRLNTHKSRSTRVREAVA